MYLIKELKEVENIFKEYFRQSTVTNNYLLMDDYKLFISKMRLYALIDNDNACFFIENENSSRLYYFINKLKGKISIKNSRPLVIEIIYRGPNNFPQDIISFWCEIGFEKYISRDAYFLKAINFKEAISLNDTDIEVKTATTKEECQFAKYLIDTYLDSYTGNPLTLEELECFKDDKNLFCAYYKNQLCGILQAELKNNVYWLGHLVVDKDFRGRKISNYLTQFYLSKGKELQCKLYQLWVIQNNDAAISLYKKMGFEYFNRSTISLLKQ